MRNRNYLLHIRSCSVKRCFLYVSSFICAVSLSLCLCACSTGAAKTSSSLETYPTTATTTKPFTTENPEPVIQRAVTATATPTPQFSVDDVQMQSTPDSSCFSEVGYDEEWNRLIVKFRDSGVVYMYYDFPVSKWKQFIAADSLGSWFNEYIKGYYDYERLES